MKGNIPIDGSIFIEFMPENSQKYVALLGIFWPFGQFLISLLSYFIIPVPSLSCTSLNCPMESNKGWRLIIIITGLSSSLIVLLRVFLIRLFESPRYLISQGKIEEAINVLNTLAKLNSKTLNLTSTDFKCESLRNNEKNSFTNALIHFKSQISTLFKHKMLRISSILIWLIYTLVSVGKITLLTERWVHVLRISSFLSEKYPSN